MHGRLKVKSSEEQLQEKNLEKQKKLKKFQSVCLDVYQKRNVKTYDCSMLLKTSEILIQNPDLYTFWNIRKESLIKFKNENPEEADELMKKELNFTIECLKSNPKSYGSWHHRCFVMETMNKPDWEGELQLCSRFLDMDNRNFHCWDYRRYVVTRSNEPLESEFQFTTSKIDADFSNFSSWHYRSNLIKKLYTDTTFPDQIQEDVISKELSLVENAIFTDPNDQSGWFYHRWLHGKKTSHLSVDAIFIDRKNARISLTLNTPVQIEVEVSIELNIDEEKKKISWRCANGRKFCKVVNAELSSESKELLKVGEHNIVFEIVGPMVLNGRSEVTCTLEEDVPFFFKHFSAYTNMCSSTKSIMEKQCTSLRELHDLEPNNKWVLFALMLVMKSLDEVCYYEEGKKYTEKLLSLDPYRTNYYNDLISRLKMEEKIKQVDKSVRCIDFSSMSLTSVYCFDLLCTMKSINLSNNEIKQMDGAYCLQSAEVLILHHNHIANCRDVCNLKELFVIDLSHNDISTIEDLLPLSTCPKLETLLLSGNPITSKSDFEKIVKDALPNIKHLS